MRIGSARAVVVVVAIQVACSSTELAARPETRDFASGTRLRARVWDVEGALVLRDFFDTQRGERCAFAEEATWRIGPGPTYYCLPLSMARHDVQSGPYRDERCTVPLGLAPQGAAAEYVLVRPLDACAAAPEVRRAGPATTSFPWVFDGGSCVHSTEPVTTQALGDVVPLDGFVRAEEHVEERNGRIASLVAIGTDGSRVTIGGFDHERNEPVRIAAVGESTVRGPFRWVPSRVAFEGAGDVLFGDAACTSVVPTKISRDAVCPLTAALSFTAQCASAIAFRELGAAVAVSRLHARAEAGACEAVEASGLLAFEPGKAIAPEALASANVLEVGSPRVHRRGFAGPGASVVVSWGDVVDVGTTEPCAPALASDGVMRCLPSASATVTLFSDEACSLPAFSQPLTGCESGEPPRFVRLAGAEGARVFAVTGDVPALYEQASPASCKRFTALVPSRSVGVEEIDVARFAAVVERDLP